MNEIGSVYVTIGGNSSQLINAARSAKREIDLLSKSVSELKQNSEQLPDFALKFKNDYFNWDSAKLKHTQEILPMSLTEQMQEWQSLRGKYSYDPYAVMNIDERIAKLMQTMAENINSSFIKYTSQRNRLNDWDSFGDSAISAFNRFKDTNYGFASDGLISEEEYFENVSALGEQMYAERVRQSRQWLEQEYKYNDLSVEDYIAGLDRMSAYTEEYYDNGLISYSTFLDGKRQISNSRADMENVLKQQQDEKNAKIYTDWLSSAQGYYKQREVYGDWDKYNDSPAEFFERSKQRVSEFFEAGIIDWDTFNSSSIEYSMKAYQARYDELEGLVDGIIEEQKNYIARVKDKLDDEIAKMESQWKLQSLKKEIGEAAAMEAAYRGAVTQKGKNKYLDYRDRLDELGHEQDIYTAQLERDKTLETIKEQYTVTESEKQQILKEIMSGNIDLSETAQLFANSAISESTDIKGLLTQILSALQNRRTASNTYNISGVDTSAFKGFVLRAASSLSSAMD
ncbi:MAG: hypothetical protein PUF72_10030 [Clostridiales bacterium]|nr:hypothetical protein [Clostridiales bacterium]